MSEQIDLVAAALAKAQGAIKNPEASADNLYFGSKYATLSSVIDAIKGPFAANGLSYVQSPEVEMRIEGAPMFLMRMVTRVMHVSGQWIESDGPLVQVVRRKSKRGASADEEQAVVGPPNAQDVTAAATYLRRCGLSAIAGVAQTDEDDDGNEASGNRVPEKKTPEARPAAAAPAMKELGADASVESLYAACMVLLNDVVTVGNERMLTLETNDRSAWKHDADEARGNTADPTMMRKVYDGLKVAVARARARKTGVN